MLKTIQELYKSAEETYLEMENKILDQAEESYDLSKDYIENTSEEITLFLNEYFNSDKTEKTNDPILLQLNRLDNSLSSLELNTDQEWDSKLIFTATSLGHLNEKITELLCSHYNINLYGNNTQAKKINLLKGHLSKTIINDLYSINSFRNSILHHNDYGHDLSNLDLVTKNKLLSEAKTSVAKFKYVYQELGNIKINKISNT